jgi:hypothetical protein
LLTPEESKKSLELAVNSWKVRTQLSQRLVKERTYWQNMKKLNLPAYESRPSRPIWSVYMVVGTGGQDFYKLNGQAPYVTKQFTGIPGFLNVGVSETRLVGSFIANDAIIEDTFTINQ